jgi:dipeptidyl aminopeptidase/acylaminoacyl peptidase
MTRTIAPYGTWPSPVTAGLLVEQAVGLADVQVAGEWIYWVESRPAEEGRQVIVRTRPGEEPADVIPGGFSARTQVHEYGGRCYAIHEETVVFSNWADQRLYAVSPGAPPRPLTPEPSTPRGDRFADPVITPDGAWLVCVHEHHDGGRTVTNDLVRVSLGSEDPIPPPRRLAFGHDFYGAPRLSPDGTRLAWMTWDHPDMPWDTTELWVADVGPDATIGPPVQVAGGEQESITQPRWSPSGTLHYVSDRSGWWNLYDEHATELCPLDAEFAGPDWQFGNASYGFGPDGTLIATWTRGAGQQIGVVNVGRAHATAFPFSRFASVIPAEKGVFAIAASPTRASAVVRLDLGSGAVSVLRTSREVPLEESDLAVPQAVDFPTGGGATAHALLYLPANGRFEGLSDERPPVVVTIHGGPTASTAPVLDLAVQYWTSRGFAVADVDYRGSTGYGRAYRRLLDGAWGVADVEDCAHVVGWLDGQGLVDGRRAVIRGGSAGGFTTLAALAFTDIFAAGASHFGVADLSLLARDTHKFESRYLDRLVGPWPEASAEYHQRSPIHHVESIRSPLILFQGLEDMVVPPAQSELMYEALSMRGVPVAYLAFAGEQHGFRQAETIVAVATAELKFYGRVFDFTPDGIEGSPALSIANEGGLRPPAS